MTPIRGGDRLKPGILVPKINIERLKRFVLDREVENGFSFCKPIPPSLSDTYYALYILKSLREKVRAKSGLLEYLKNSLKDESYSIFYVLNCLKLLNRSLPDKSTFLQNRIEEILGKIRKGEKRYVSHTSGGDESSRRIGAFTTYSFESPSLLGNCICLPRLLDYLGKG